MKICLPPFHIRRKERSPVKEACHRSKTWFERGSPAKKNEIDRCSLCHLDGHTALNCDFRQGECHDTQTDE